MVRGVSPLTEQLFGDLTADFRGNLIRKTTLIGRFFTIVRIIPGFSSSERAVQRAAYDAFSHLGANHRGEYKDLYREYLDLRKSSSFTKGEEEAAKAPLFTEQPEQIEEQIELAQNKLKSCTMSDEEFERLQLWHEPCEATYGDEHPGVKNKLSDLGAKLLHKGSTYFIALKAFYDDFNKQRRRGGKERCGHSLSSLVDAYYGTEKCVNSLRRGLSEALNGFVRREPEEQKEGRAEFLNQMHKHLLETGADLRRQMEEKFVSSAQRLPQTMLVLPLSIGCHKSVKQASLPNTLRWLRHQHLPKVVADMKMPELLARFPGVAESMAEIDPSIRIAADFFEEITFGEIVDALISDDERSERPLSEIAKKLNTRLDEAHFSPYYRALLLGLLFGTKNLEDLKSRQEKEGGGYLDLSIEAIDQVLARIGQITNPISSIDREAHTERMAATAAIDQEALELRQRVLREGLLPQMAAGVFSLWSPEHTLGTSSTQVSSFESLYQERPSLTHHLRGEVAPESKKNRWTSEDLWIEVAQSASTAEDEVELRLISAAPLKGYEDLFPVTFIVKKEKLTAERIARLLAFEFEPRYDQEAGYNFDHFVTFLKRDLEATLSPQEGIKDPEAIEQKRSAVAESPESLLHLIAEDRIGEADLRHLQFFAHYETVKSYYQREKERRGASVVEKEFTRSMLQEIPWHLKVLHQDALELHQKFGRITPETVNILYHTKLAAFEELDHLEADFVKHISSIDLRNPTYGPYFEGQELLAKLYRAHGATEGTRLHDEAKLLAKVASEVEKLHGLGTKLASLGYPVRGLETLNKQAIFARESKPTLKPAQATKTPMTQEAAKEEALRKPTNRDLQALGHFISLWFNDYYEALHYVDLARHYVGPKSARLLELAIDAHWPEAVVPRESKRWIKARASLRHALGTLGAAILSPPIPSTPLSDAFWVPSEQEKRPPNFSMESRMRAFGELIPTLAFEKEMPPMMRLLRPLERARTSPFDDTASLSTMQKVSKVFIKNVSRLVYASVPRPMIEFTIDLVASCVYYVENALHSILATRNKIPLSLFLPYQKLEEKAQELLAFFEEHVSCENFEIKIHRKSTSINQGEYGAKPVELDTWFATNLPTIQDSETRQRWIESVLLGALPSCRFGGRELEVGEVLVPDAAGMIDGEPEQPKVYFEEGNLSGEPWEFQQIRWPRGLIQNYPTLQNPNTLCLTRASTDAKGKTYQEVIALTPPSWNPATHSAADFFASFKPCSWAHFRFIPPQPIQVNLQVAASFASRLCYALYSRLNPFVGAASNSDPLFAPSDDLGTLAPSTMDWRKLLQKGFEGINSLQEEFKKLEIAHLELVNCSALRIPLSHCHHHMHGLNFAADPLIEVPDLKGGPLSLQVGKFYFVQKHVEGGETRFELVYPEGYAGYTLARDQRVRNPYQILDRAIMVEREEKRLALVDPEKLRTHLSLLPKLLGPLVELGTSELFGGSHGKGLIDFFENHLGSIFGKKPQFIEISSEGLPTTKDPFAAVQLLLCAFINQNEQQMEHCLLLLEKIAREEPGIPQKVKQQMASISLLHQFISFLGQNRPMSCSYAMRLQLLCDGAEVLPPKSLQILISFISPWLGLEALTRDRSAGGEGDPLPAADVGEGVEEQWECQIQNLGLEIVILARNYERFIRSSSPQERLSFTPELELRTLRRIRELVSEMAKNLLDHRNARLLDKLHPEARGILARISKFAHLFLLSSQVRERLFALQGKLGDYDETNFPLQSASAVSLALEIKALISDLHPSSHWFQKFQTSIGSLVRALDPETYLTDRKREAAQKHDPELEEASERTLEAASFAHSVLQDPRSQVMTMVINKVMPNGRAEATYSALSKTRNAWYEGLARDLLFSNTPRALYKDLHRRSRAIDSYTAESIREFVDAPETTYNYARLVEHFHLVSHAIERPGEVMRSEELEKVMKKISSRLESLNASQKMLVTLLVTKHRQKKLVELQGVAFGSTAGALVQGALSHAAKIMFSSLEQLAPAAQASIGPISQTMSEALIDGAMFGLRNSLKAEERARFDVGLKELQDQYEEQKRLFLPYVEAASSLIAGHLEEKGYTVERARELIQGLKNPLPPFFPPASGVTGEEEAHFERLCTQALVIDAFHTVPQMLCRKHLLPLVEGLKIGSLQELTKVPLIHGWVSPYIALAQFGTESAGKYDQGTTRVANALHAGVGTLIQRTRSTLNALDRFFGDGLTHGRPIESNNAYAPGPLMLMEQQQQELSQHLKTLFTACIQEQREEAAEKVASRALSRPGRHDDMKCELTDIGAPQVEYRFNSDQVLTVLSKLRELETHCSSQAARLSDAIDHISMKREKLEEGVATPPLQTLTPDQLLSVHQTWEMPAAWGMQKRKLDTALGLTSQRLFWLTWQRQIMSLTSKLKEIALLHAGDAKKVDIQTKLRELLAEKQSKALWIGIREDSRNHSRKREIAHFEYERGRFLSDKEFDAVAGREDLSVVEALEEAGHLPKKRPQIRIAPMAYCSDKYLIAPHVPLPLGIQGLRKISKELQKAKTHNKSIDLPIELLLELYRPENMMGAVGNAGYYAERSDIKNLLAGIEDVEIDEGSFERYFHGVIELDGALIYTHHGDLPKDRGPLSMDLSSLRRLLDQESHDPTVLPLTSDGFIDLSAMRNCLSWEEAAALYDQMRDQAHLYLSVNQLSVNECRLTFNTPSDSDHKLLTQDSKVLFCAFYDALKNGRLNLSHLQLAKLEASDFSEVDQAKLASLSQDDPLLETLTLFGGEPQGRPPRLPSAPGESSSRRALSFDLLGECFPRSPYIRLKKELPREGSDSAALRQNLRYFAASCGQVAWKKPVSPSDGSRSSIASKTLTNLSELAHGRVVIDLSGEWNTTEKLSTLLDLASQDANFPKGFTLITINPAGERWLWTYEQEEAAALPTSILGPGGGWKAVQEQTDVPFGGASLILMTPEEIKDLPENIVPLVLTGENTEAADLALLGLRLSEEKRICHLADLKRGEAPHSTHTRFFDAPPSKPDRAFLASVITRSLDRLDRSLLSRSGSI